MQVDMMQNPLFAKMITMLFRDQGLTPPLEYQIDESKWDLGVAEGWLKKLNDYELETFCIGDQEDMQAMIANAPDTEGAEAAHKVLDHLFLELLHG